MAIDPTQKFYDALVSSYDILSDAVAKSSQLGVKVGERLSADVAKGQKEAVELAKKIGSNTGDVNQIYATVLEATTAAQSRALEFAQVAYQESVVVGTEFRATFEKLIEANRETAQAAMEAVRTTIAKNPFAADEKPAATKKSTAA